MKRGLAIFDFDGTITSRDTFLDFLFYTTPWPRLAWKFCAAALPILFRILQTRSFSEGKEVVFRTIFSGQKEEGFRKLCAEYAEKHLPRLVKNEALEKIAWHKNQNHTLVILSASLAPYLEPWASHYGFTEVIATVPEIKNGYVTGRFSTPNCVGEEKKRRLLTAIPNLETYETYGYGNSRNDLPFLRLTTHHFFNVLD